MGVYGIAVLDFFSCGIAVILILTCGIAVSSRSKVCGFSSFWLTVFGEIRLFTVSWYMVNCGLLAKFIFWIFEFITKLMKTLYCI